MKKQTYDLAERPLEYSVRIIKIVEQLPNSKAGSHVAGQLLKSGTIRRYFAGNRKLKEIEFLQFLNP
ncbi:hypothetical protein D1BOALGB6SA_2185 [Olavius sp. associated proteobacterium Delta 1]|nr:hypothetical protein D1BOALGB6SA_2185 [Olavius sp. associated proteobacterium Delta 1]